MKLMVYPATKEASSLARYKDLMKKYDEVAFVAPIGWRGTLSDFSEIDGGTITRVNVYSDYSNCLDSADAVLFMCEPALLPIPFIKNKIEEAIIKQKEVLLDRVPTEIDINDEICKINAMISRNSGLELKNEMIHPPVFTIPIPVICVMGVGPNTNKFETALGLRRRLTSKGYKVSQVGTKRLSSLFGISSLPKDIFENKISIKEKIVLLNRFFYQIAVDEKADVLIVGIPGGIMPLNSLRYEDMDEMAYLISRAIQPDASILCSYAHEISQELIDQLNCMCKYRLNTNLRHIVISCTSVDLTSDTSESEFSTIPISFIKKKYINQQYEGISLYCALDPEDMERLGDAVIDDLANNM